MTWQWEHRVPASGYSSAKTTEMCSLVPASLGGTSAIYFPEIFDALKVSASFVYGDWTDLASQLQGLDRLS